MTVRCHRCHAGFTLIELMAAMAIGAGVLLTAAMMLGGSSTNFERVGGRIAAEREARSAITCLIADLTNAATKQSLVFDESNAVWAKDRLGVLCLQPASAQSDAGRIGDLCAVCYYVDDLTIGGATLRCLMRGCRESAEVFRALEDNRIERLFADRRPADEPVAFGVLEFAARPQARTTRGGWQAWTKDAGGQPQALDVTLVVARRTLAARLRTAADWNGTGPAASWLGVAKDARNHPDLEVYQTRIELTGHDQTPPSMP